jgi:hypothetical protein
MLTGQLLVGLAFSLHVPEVFALRFLLGFFESFLHPCLVGSKPLPEERADRSHGAMVREERANPPHHCLAIYVCALQLDFSTPGIRLLPDQRGYGGTCQGSVSLAVDDTVYCVHITGNKL